MWASRLVDTAAACNTNACFRSLEVLLEHDLLWGSADIHILQSSPDRKVLSCQHLNHQAIAPKDSCSLQIDAWAALHHHCHSCRPSQNHITYKHHNNVVPKRYCLQLCLQVSTGPFACRETDLCIGRWYCLNPIKIAFCMHVLTLPDRDKANITESPSKLPTKRMIASSKVAHKLFMLLMSPRWVTIINALTEDAESIPQGHRIPPLNSIHWSRSMLSDVERNCFHCSTVKCHLLLNILESCLLNKHAEIVDGQHSWSAFVLSSSLYHVLELQRVALHT